MLEAIVVGSLLWALGVSVTAYILVQRMRVSNMHIRESYKMQIEAKNEILAENVRFVRTFLTLGEKTEDTVYMINYNATKGNPALKPPMTTNPGFRNLMEYGYTLMIETMGVIGHPEADAVKVRIKVNKDGE